MSGPWEAYSSSTTPAAKTAAPWDEYQPKTAKEGLEAIEPSVPPTKEKAPSLLEEIKGAGGAIGSAIVGSVVAPVANVIGATEELLKGDFGKGTAEKRISSITEAATKHQASLTEEKYSKKIGQAMELAGAIAGPAGAELQAMAAAKGLAPREGTITKPPISSPEALTKLEEIAKKPAESKQLELFSPENIKREQELRASSEAPAVDHDIKQSSDWRAVHEAVGQAKTVPEALEATRGMMTEDQQALVDTLQQSGILQQASFGLKGIVKTDKGQMVSGTYHGAEHHVNLNAGGNVKNLLHEAVHAATSRLLAVQEHPAVRPLVNLFNEMDGKGVELHGMKNVKEFVAEAFTNPKFQAFLKEHRTGNWWDKFKTAVAQVLGFEHKARTAFDDVMEHGKNLIETGKQEQARLATKGVDFSLEEDINAIIKAHPDFHEFEKALVTKYGEEARALAPQLFRQSSDSVRPMTPKELGDNFFQKNQSQEAVSTELRQNYEQGVKAGITKQLGEKFRDYGDHLTTLTPEEKVLYDRYIQPLIDKTNRLLETAQTYSDKEFDINGYFNPRVALGHFSVWDRILGGTGEAFQSPTGKVASILKSRKVFALEDADGGRTTISVEGGKVVAWKDGMPTEIGKYSKRSDIASGKDFQGKKIVDAAERDIMNDSPIKYLRDDMAVRTIKLMELEKYVNDQKFLDTLVNSPDFHTIALTEKEAGNLPDGWRKMANPSAIPKLQEYYFNPRIAEVLDDFTKGQSPSKIIAGVNKFNNLAISSIMLDPIPHINNELWHWFTSRGLVGDWLNPAGLQRLGKTFAPSVGSVLRQDKFQQEMLRNGASLMYPRVKNQGWLQNMLTTSAKDVVERDPGALGVTKALGTAAGEMYSKVSRLSSTVMWSARDAMYTQLVKDKMLKGMSVREAIAETERHMPSYRIPPRVLEKALGANLSRGLSEGMQNPVISVFSRYHYGVLKHMGETMKDITTPGRTGKGLDTMATMVVGYALMYPILDKLLQTIVQQMGTPSQDAEELQWRRAGGAHYASLVEKGMNDELGLASIFTALLTPSPAIGTGMGLWENRDLFTGKEQIDLHDPVTIFDTAMSTAGKAFAPGRTALSMSSDQMSTPQWAWSLSDVEQKTAAKEHSIEKGQRFKRYERKRRGKKRPGWEKDLME